MNTRVSPGIGAERLIPNRIETTEKRMRRLFATLEAIQGKIYGEIFRRFAEPGNMVKHEILDSVDKCIIQYVKDIGGVDAL